jgi:hypothetical protein
MDSDAEIEGVLPRGRSRLSRLTVREIMILTGAVGGSLGLFLRDPGGTFLGGLLLVLFWVALKRWLHKVPLEWRLFFEVATLILLLHWSTIIWTPWFYPYQADRCKNLAWTARMPIEGDQGRRIALDREADWFERRAAELRRKGWWRGLILGRSNQDDRLADLAYEFGTLESIEKHEKTLNKLLNQPPR